MFESSLLLWWFLFAGVFWHFVLGMVVLMLHSSARNSHGRWRLMCQVWKHPFACRIAYWNSGWHTQKTLKDKQDWRITGKLRFLAGLRQVTCDPQMLIFILCITEKNNKNDNTRILTRNGNLVSGTSICEWTSHRGALGLWLDGVWQCINVVCCFRQWTTSCPVSPDGSMRSRAAQKIQKMRCWCRHITVPESNGLENQLTCTHFSVQVMLPFIYVSYIYTVCILLYMIYVFILFMYNIQWIYIYNIIYI